MALRAAVDATDAEGRTALHWAATCAPHVVHQLLEARADAQRRDALRRTPLDWAVRARCARALGQDGRGQETVQPRRNTHSFLCAAP